MSLEFHIKVLSQNSVGYLMESLNGTKHLGQKSRKIKYYLMLLTYIKKTSLDNNFHFLIENSDPNWSPCEFIRIATDTFNGMKSVWTKSWNLKFLFPTWQAMETNLIFIQTVKNYLVIFLKKNRHVCYPFSSELELVKANELNFLIFQRIFEIFCYFCQ